MNRVLVTLIILSISFIEVFAQTATIEDVRRREFKGISPIINEIDNTVEGYFTFYFSEKAKKGIRDFHFVVYDENLKLIKNSTVTVSKRSTLDASSYNGKHFLFALNDMSKKKVSFISMDRKGNILKQKDVDTERRTLTTSDIYAADDGFFLVKPVKEDKYGYQIEKVDENISTLWEQTFTPDKGYIAVEDIHSSGDQIFVIQQTAPSILRPKSSKGELIALSSSDGSNLFSYPLFNGEVTCQPSSISLNQKGEVVLGGMYFEGEKWDNVNSDGIFFTRLNTSGEEISFEMTSWDTGLQKALNGGGGLRIGSKPKVIFHNVIQNSDGSYQIVGETFQKNLNLTPRLIADTRSLITGLFIGDPSQDGILTTLEIMDFIVFSYSAEGKLSTLYNYEKENTKVFLYPPYSGVGGLYLAKLLVEYNMFNYGFVISRENGGEVEHLLVSRNLTKKYRNIRVQPLDPKRRNELSEIPLEKKWVKGYVGVAPNSDSKVCVYFFSGKEKTISIMLKEFSL